MKKSQLNWVKEKLETYGAVGRNQALQNRITRLGAIIHTLKAPPHSMNITTDYEGPEGDCVYRLTPMLYESTPKTPKEKPRYYVRNPDGTLMEVT